MNEHIVTDTNSINPNYTYSELTSRIIKCAMAVHNYLGNACLPKLQRRQGFQEVIYQRALSIEFQMQNLRFIRECEMSVFYHDIQIGSRRVDFLVEDKISVELKVLLSSRRFTLHKSTIWRHSTWRLGFC